jgi:hypothetical protein
VQTSRRLWSRIVSTRSWFSGRSLKPYSCWVCLAPWGPIIRGDNSRHYDNCSHYTGRPGGNPAPNIRPISTRSTGRASSPQVIEPIHRVIEIPQGQLNAINRGHLPVRGNVVQFDGVETQPPPPPPYRPNQRNMKRLDDIFSVCIYFYIFSLPVYALIFFSIILGWYRLRCYRISGRWHPHHRYTRGALTALVTWIPLGILMNMTSRRCLNGLNVHCVLGRSAIQSCFMPN